MRRWGIGLLVVASIAAAPVATAAPTESTLDAITGDAGSRSITYLGAVRDQRDLSDLGAAGSWFPQFDTVEETETGPTGAGARDALPSWVTAFNHTTHPTDPGCAEPGALERGCRPTYLFRTFSQDGPARSAGGFDEWSLLELPGGECGRAGAIVDPQTFVADQAAPDPTGVVVPREGDPKPNNNNTVNRIQLTAGTPSTFYLGVLVDATAGTHAVSRLEIRGNIGALDIPEDVSDGQIEPTFDAPADLGANGVPDLHVFRVDGFLDGDYLKVRLRGVDGPAAFSGLVFDTEFDLGRLGSKPGRPASAPPLPPQAEAAGLHCER